MRSAAGGNPLKYITDENRRDVAFWDHDKLIGTFSRQDRGLIAIGRPLPDGGETWVHIDAYKLQQLINDALHYWAAQKEEEVRR